MCAFEVGVISWVCFYITLTQYEIKKIKMCAFVFNLFDGLIETVQYTCRPSNMIWYMVLYTSYRTF